VHDLTLDLGGRQATVTIETAVVAGWTGRDRGAVEEHIAELEASRCGATIERAAFLLRRRVQHRV